MQERQTDSNRALGDNWGLIVDYTDVSSAQIINSVEDLSKDISIVPESSFKEIEKKYFLQFSFIPVSSGAKKGLIVGNLFTRVPEFIHSKYLDFLIYAPSSVCSSLLLNKFLPPLSSRLKETDTPLAFVENVIAKMEDLHASDVTFSWKKDHISVMYSAGQNNMKAEEDSVSVAFGEKLRVAIINLAYERPSETIVDGKFSLIVFGEKREYRLSVLPTVSGYSIVVRSYQKFNKDMKLEDLGYTAKPQAIIKGIIKDNVHGLFLLTGPTGSGKTTTIYTLMQEMNNDRYLKIKSAEDPVEIQLDGIDQCQVNNHGAEEHKITYKKLLKGFMRQKPDVIMIGEIRDEDVADAVIEASLTGHMVISTLHTGDVETTFSRLRTALNIGDDKIEDSLIGVLNQRLVPKLCECKIKGTGKHFKKNPDGCDVCKKAGTTGYFKEVVTCEIAALKRGFENYKEENYKAYYSYSQSAKDLYDSGVIDLQTSNFIKKIS